MKLHSVKFGLAIAIVWSVVTFIMALTSMYLGWCDQMQEVLSSIYIGYMPTWTGAFIGLVWAFIDAFIGGFLVAWLYNKLVG